MNFLRIFIVMLSFIMAACASREAKPPKTQESFVTLIKRDGSKQFNYTMIMEMPKGGKSRGAGRHGGPGPGGAPGGHPGGPPPGGHDRSGGEKKGSDDGAMTERLSFIFNEGLLAKIADTGFCQQGYKQLDKKSRLGVMQISGECNDIASGDDRKKFPNPPPIKVREETIE